MSDLLPPPQNQGGSPKAVVEIGLAEIYATLVDVRENVIEMRADRRGDLDRMGAIEKSYAELRDEFKIVQRRVWQIPSLSGLLSLASVAVAVWAVVRG